MHRLAVSALFASLVIVAGCDFHMFRDRDIAPVEDVEIRPPLYDDPVLTALWNDVAQIVRTDARRESMCAVAPIGAKPCGGPWSYVVYSSSATDGTRLRGAISRFDEHQRKLNRRLGMYSTCELAAVPTVRLDNGHCRAVRPDHR
jgi:hypothetical protein